MLAELVDDQFTLNGALPRSLAALLARPGHLTREYAAGRIARYVRPFRLFLLASVIFFVALSTLADPDRMYADLEAQVGDVEELQAGGDFQNVNIGIDTAAAPGWTRPLLRRLKAQEARLNAMPADESLRLVMGSTLRMMPRLALALVPVLALILLGLHFRRHPRYVKHFVFALHLQAAAFLLLTPAVLLNVTALWVVAALGLAVYLVVALRTAYDQAWWLAGVKAVGVFVAYQAALVVALIVSFTIVLLMA